VVNDNIPSLLGGNEASVRTKQAAMTLNIRDENSLMARISHCTKRNARLENKLWNFTVVPWFLYECRLFNWA